MRATFLGLSLILLLVGCAEGDIGGPTATPTALPTATSIPTPTNTPLPTVDIMVQTERNRAERELHEIKASMKEYIRHKELTDVPFIYEPTNDMTKFPAPYPMALFNRAQGKVVAYYHEELTRYLYTYEDGEVIQHGLAKN